MPNSEEKKRGSIFKTIRRAFTLNIGTILFGVLLIYMIFSLVIYLTATHYTIYHVVSGPLSSNETYTGLALRDEMVVPSSVGGYVNYYAREGDRINCNGVVYGISSDSQVISDTDLSAEDLSRVRQELSTYSYSFDSNNFNSVYSFKSKLEGDILQYETGVVDETIPNYSDSDSDAYSDSDMYGDNYLLGNQTICASDVDGVVLYFVDGYEDVSFDSITTEDFNQKSYHKTDLKTRSEVQPGDSIYKIVTSETWSVYVQLSDKQAAELEDKTSIKVKFLKDNITQTASLSLVEINDETYGKLDFTNGMVRYASDRFLDIELVTNTETGLKLPLSAVTTKDFYMIPVDFQTKGGSDNEVGFLVQDNENEGAVEFVNATIYDQQDDFYYVEQSAFDEGTVLVNPSSNDKFVVGETGSLEGVYCINEGYARFRRIVIVDQNEEYCIVETGTPYGLSLYDNIIYDAADVNEEDILI